MTLYVATTNSGKLRDFAAALSDIDLMPLHSLASISAPSEDELTFEGNARTKAVYYSKYAPGEIVLADDSGLEVDALHGAPGVRSARYADDCGYPGIGDTGDTDARNNACLLHALTNITNRQARYRCVLAAARDGEVLYTAKGSVEGEILFAPRGTAGFGYDPLFFLPQYGLTMAEIDLAQRLTVSHRAHALRALSSGLLAVR